MTQIKKSGGKIRYIPRGNRAKLEKLCQYILRPPVSNERISFLPNGHIAYKLKTPYSDGRTYVFFEPIKFIEKLASLIPPPRSNLLHFHGVFAPHSKLRKKIVPPNDFTQNAQTRSYRSINSWAMLMKKCFAHDPLECPNCSSRMTIISIILDRETTRTILSSLNLPVDPPFIHPARASP